MKSIMSSLLVVSLILVVSANTSFAQQVKERTKAELNITKTEKLRADVRKALLKEDFQQKNNLKARPVKARAKIKAQPTRIRIERK